MNNKTIIISCAGMGKRLGSGIPKALVEFDGKPLIIRQLEMLDKCNDVRIIVGFKAQDVIDTVLKYRKDVTFVFNNDYMNNGTGASVSLGVRYSNEYVITIDGDLLIHPEDMNKILEFNDEFIGVCNTSTDNPVLTIIENDKVVGFSRSNGIYEWTGISQFKSNKIKEGAGHVYQLLEPLLPLDYLFLRTKEIDTPNDYNNAVRWVKNNYSDNLTIGVIGGMGSVATVDFFDRLVSAFPAEKEWERPRIIIDNRCNMPSRVRSILYNERYQELLNSIEQSIDMMLDNNCDYVVLACNTSHAILNDLLEKRNELNEKVLNIIELCVKKLHDDDINEPLLLASEGTYLSKIYDRYFEKYDISYTKVDKELFPRIRMWIESVKQQKITDEIKNDFINFICENNSNTIILGCTELPILYRLCRESINKKIYDPLQCAIDFLVKKQNDND